MGEIRGNIMKKNAYKIACGFAAASIVALALSACESSSTSPVICSCEKPDSCDSQDSTVNSSAAMSSSSVSSSASTLPDGKKQEQCFTMESMCPPCDDDDCPATIVPCNYCGGLHKNDTLVECGTEDIYICGISDTWVPSCVHLIESDGTAKKNLKCSINLFEAADCNTGKPIICKDYKWQENPDVITSSSAVESSSAIESSSAVASSSSMGRIGRMHEECFVYETMCPPCNEEDCPVTNVACNDCHGLQNDTLVECGTNNLFICRDMGYWGSYCVHMKDSSGVAKADIPCHHEHAIAKDCDTDGTLICREGTWHALTENDSWVGEPCTEQGKIKTIPLDYKTVKGESFTINTRYYCDDGNWTEVHTNEPLKDIPCVTGDTVTVGKTTYECDEGTWFDSERRAIAIKDCSASPLIGADCTEADDEWVYDIGCAYHCRDGKYSLE